MSFLLVGLFSHVSMEQHGFAPFLKFRKTWFVVLSHDLAWGICSMLVRGVCSLPLVSGLFSHFF